MDIGREAKILGDKIEKLEANLRQVLGFLDKKNGNPPMKVELNTMASSVKTGCFRFDMNSDKVIRLVDSLMEIERDEIKKALEICKENLRDLLK